VVRQTVNSLQRALIKKTSRCELFFYSHYFGNGGVALGAVSVVFSDFGICMVCKKRLGSVSAIGLDLFGIKDSAADSTGGMLTVSAVA
jgi:hypothetical protein